jgi:hypothetical protein
MKGQRLRSYHVDLASVLAAGTVWMETDREPLTGYGHG